MDRREKISESIFIGSILALTGGFLDAYSYIVRGGVFANAETGNIVLMGIKIAEGNWSGALYYLVPIVSFAAGIFAAERIRELVGEQGKLHWKEGILCAELVLVFLSGWIPQNGNFIVNTTIAFICAMQVEAFRKIRGKAFATTMCTGNLRSGTELLCSGDFRKDPKKRREGLHFYWINLVFVVGAVIGTLLSRVAAEKAVWFCCASLLISIYYIRIKKIDGEI